MTETASPDTATGLVIKGNVHGGQQPVVGAHVYLLQANTTGYGAASVSTLVPTSTGLSDSIGAYVLTDSTGSFNISGDYTCTANDQYYLYALGGNPGAGTNTAAGFLAAIGNCPSNGSFATTVPFIYMNEVSTVATAYAVAGFAVDATHFSSSGSALAVNDIADAFLNVPNLVPISTGVANSTTPAGNGTVPAATINTIANILASCVNSTGATSYQCTTLFANDRSNGTTGTMPTDTATAAINIAHNPGNVAPLYSLASPAAAFAPALTTQPNDFLIGINYSGVGVTGSGLNGAYSIAIDSQGNAWFTNVNNNSISKLSSTGAPESPATGFTGGNQAIPTGIAIDPSDRAWVVDSASNNLTEYSTAGVPLSPVGGYTGGGLASPQAIGIDGSGNIWAVNFANSSASLFNNSGVAQSPSTGFTGGGTNAPTGLGIDRFGYPWIANQKPGAGTISKFNTNGAPISSPAGYPGGGVDDPFSVAIDGSNHVWIANYAGNSIAELDTNGNALSGSSGFTGGGLNNPYFVAVDGSGHIWTANFGNSTVSEFTNSGTAISPSTGFAVGGVSRPEAIEIDGSGDVWITNYSTSSSTVNAVTELIGAATPRVTPLSVAVKNSTLGTRP